MLGLKSKVSSRWYLLLNSLYILLSLGLSIVLLLSTQIVLPYLLLNILQLGLAPLLFITDQEGRYKLSNLDCDKGWDAFICVLWWTVAWSSVFAVYDVADVIYSLASYTTLTCLPGSLLVQTLLSIVASIAVTVPHARSVFRELGQFIRGSDVAFVHMEPVRHGSASLSIQNEKRIQLSPVVVSSGKDAAICDPQSIESPQPDHEQVPGSFLCPPA